MTTEQIELAPIVFTPLLKSVIWGGTKIYSYKGIPQTGTNIGESWEISAVPGHESVVESGLYQGLRLNELIARFGEQLLGSSVYRRYDGRFPLLVKLIDANDNLSVQVHPDDELAMRRHGSLGKTEMWYIIDSEPGAKIYSGIKGTLTPDLYAKKVADGSFAETLAEHDSSPGKVFFLPAGRIHAIGTGNLLAEIQESSDITYRIYDYGRTDSEGNQRELHTALAKDAIDFSCRDNCDGQLAPTDISDCEIVNCRHFNVRQLLLDNRMTLQSDRTSFTILMCIKGNATISYPSGQLMLRQGHTILLPAEMTWVGLSGKATLLVAGS